MATKPTVPMLSVLCQIDDAGSAVIVSERGMLRILCAGEYIKCLPDTILRLLAGGWLITYGDWRIEPTTSGKAEADIFRDSQTYQREQST